MSLDRAKAHLEQFGLAGRIQLFDVSSATVELAAQAVGVEPARIAKTMSFYAKEPGACILVVAAGDQKINSGKFKQQFGWKAKMLAAEDVERLTGHAPGGVCPFDNPEGCKVYLDRSLQRFSTIFPAAGSANSAVEMSCQELEAASHSLGWVDLCKAPISEEA